MIPRDRNHNGPGRKSDRLGDSFTTKGETMKTSLTFLDGCHSESIAYIRPKHVRVANGVEKAPARLYAKDCRKLAAWLIEAADEMERKDDGR